MRSAALSSSSAKERRVIEFKSPFICRHSIPVDFSQPVDVGKFRRMSLRSARTRDRIIEAVDER
jgi:hypothetical protein